jgi:hypothetical protein
MTQRQAEESNCSKNYSHTLLVCLVSCYLLISVSVVMVQYTTEKTAFLRLACKIRSVRMRFPGNTIPRKRGIHNFIKKATSIWSFLEGLWKTIKNQQKYFKGLPVNECLLMLIKVYYWEFFNFNCL